MSKRNILLHSAVALALAGVSAVGFAAVTTAGLLTTYATENFPGQDTVIVPGNPVTLTEAAAADAPVGGGIAFKLSSGTFAAAPSAVIGGSVGGTKLTLVSNVASLSADKTVATFQVATASLVTGSTIALSNVTLTGVSTALTNVGNQITVQPTVTGSAPATVAIAQSQRAYAFASFAAANGTIDVANGGQGQKFRNGSLNQLFWPLGTTQILGFTGATLIDGTTVLIAGVGDTAGATLSGDVSAFSSVYLVSTVTPCAGTVPTGALTGTATATGATFTGLAIGTSYNVCVIANGTNIIPGLGANSTGAFSIKPNLTFTSRTAAATTYTPDPSSPASTTINILAYNGTVASYNYFVGSASGYTGLVRAANNGARDATIYAVVRREDGTLFNNLNLGTLKAGTQAFYGAAELQAANGGTAVLTSAFPRATITVLSSNTQTTFIDLLSNPGGTVNLLQ